MDKKTNLILEYCKNKDVLDIGCVNHNAVAEVKEKDWVHGKILKVARSVFGIDYLEKDVEILKTRGYNMAYANAENFHLNKKFDVIVAGELIEHLFNPGRFLDSVKKHMRKDSILILTTPNAFSYRRMIGSIFLGKLKENEEHVSYYSDITITQLLKRKGFSKINVKYVESNDVGFSKFIERILNLIFRRGNKNNLFVLAKWN